MPAQQLLEIKKFSDEWAQIVGNRKDYRTLYIMLMVLITLFVLFVATWLARILANRISTPITAHAGSRRRGAPRQSAASRDGARRGRTRAAGDAASTR